MSPETIDDRLAQFPAAALPGVKAAVLAYLARLCPECCQPAPVRTKRGRVRYLQCPCGWRGKVAETETSTARVVPTQFRALPVPDRDA